ncbi:hypothetical protein [Litoreibacter roseus]|uniref:Uncharacterized protein n=1 Tax=Litoreibacter roseus TaxID=2601869 RepID=A0A6N6JJC0_9RHOB|nr:hypothetical protein [Litoreibacter roseus]GFE66443.1 hypothetical protein KIN_35170 [Litoreibacter roseus]
MLKSFISTGLVAGTLLAGTSAIALTDIESVDVSVDLEAIQNEKAALYWTSIADDLETAIIQRITDRIADKGTTVEIDIDEVSLANTFESVLDLEQSTLVGMVEVDDYPNAGKNQEYQLTVSYLQAQQFFPENVDISKITADSPEYYEGMIAAFADRVVEKLP